MLPIQVPIPDDQPLITNLLHYEYNVDHLLSLEAKGLTPEDEAYISAFRSFEGEVYENYSYEKLLRYAISTPQIERFIIKGPHKERSKALSDTLSISWKGQIIYRARHKEIGEFDALFFTKRSLYFVEMTLVKSIGNLKKRLRKKKALLEVLFPSYKIKALLVLTSNVVTDLPEYVHIWVNPPLDARVVLDELRHARPPESMQNFHHPKLVHVDSLKVASFKYYATLSWILFSLRRKEPMDLTFFHHRATQRYHDIYTKIYIGYLEIPHFIDLFETYTLPPNSHAKRVVVAIEKDHTGGYFLTYFIRHSTRWLDTINTHPQGIKVDKKDPFGITLTEINHLDRVMDERFVLTLEHYRKLLQLIPTLEQK